MKEHQSINYIYFGILFLLLFILHVYHVFLIEKCKRASIAFFIRSMC